MPALYPRSSALLRGGESLKGGAGWRRCAPLPQPPLLAIAGRMHASQADKAHARPLAIPFLRRIDDGQEISRAIRRQASILIGIVVAALAQLLVLPLWARRQLCERLAAALEDAVGTLRCAGSSVLYRPQGGGQASGSPGAAGDAQLASRTTVLQRAQRQAMAAMDALLVPTATVRVPRGCSSGALVGPIALVLCACGRGG